MIYTFSLPPDQLLTNIRDNQILINFIRRLTHCVIAPASPKERSRGLSAKFVVDLRILPQLQTPDEGMTAKQVDEEKKRRALLEANAADENQLAVNAVVGDDGLFPVYDPIAFDLSVSATSNSDTEEELLVNNNVVDCVTKTKEDFY